MLEPGIDEIKEIHGTDNHTMIICNTSIKQVLLDSMSLPK